MLSGDPTLENENIHALHFSYCWERGHYAVLTTVVHVRNFMYKDIMHSPTMSKGIMHFIKMKKLHIPSNSPGHLSFVPVDLPLHALDRYGSLHTMYPLYH